MNNPYTPPSGELRDPARPPGSAIRAVSMALLVDIGGTVVSSTLFAALYAFQLAASGLDEKRVNATVADPPVWSWYFIVCTIVGLAFSGLGGHVCERIARRGNYNLGLVCGGLSAAFGIVVAWSSFSLAAHLFMATIGLACVLLGVRTAIGKP